MAITCKAAIANGNGTFTIEDIEVQNPEADEVLVKIMAAGLCHTDHDSLSWGKKLIIGHEGAGVIVKTGSDVTGLAPGDRVILNWAMHCGHCFQCLEGNQHLCEIASPVAAGGNGYTPGHAHLSGTTFNGESILRSFNIGTIAQYTLVKASAVVKNTSATMSFPAASIISCGVMTGYGSVVNAAKVKAGSSVVVLGTGGVGLNVIQGAKIAGAGMIIAIDINQNRLDMAVKFGATHTILADKADTGLLKAAQQVKTITQRGADYAFECTAIPELGAAPLAMVRNAGTAVQVSGIEQNITIDMRLFEWDKVYINPLYGKCRPQIDFPELIKHYQNGSLLLEEMITRTYKINELDKAFDDMLKGRNAKGVIVFDHEDAL
ncbi:alcohol dehydrogenase catalytic domain-containing protein [Mucilaginibacter sp. FT3.2]|uniref:alcohol dehydrogenase catalytic domain-containing protein n=1 Tax=Mucilaginibacter sp. FT3.2 TaxID=2723090 RepID=UPI00160B492C|nr:alcohol dehydrogenase catalytic domain-containing protein [Mucilaginibacter sp. FT3.2]MBB6232591.1 S-(hydroxymethyl)glutathione dehydrogenase/alcohol dehydrogenase [Mucilaginibacter sp. FT3.2]